jgi:hypothetical protein
LAPDTLRYYNIPFDEVASRFPSDNEFILHTRFSNTGPVVLSSVVSKMDQFPLIPPKVDGDASIVLNNTQVSQFTSLTRSQAIGRLAHIAVRNWHATQAMSYSITAGFARESPKLSVAILCSHSVYSFAQFGFGHNLVN